MLSDPRVLTIAPSNANVRGPLMKAEFMLAVPAQGLLSPAFSPDSQDMKSPSIAAGALRIPRVAWELLERGRNAGEGAVEGRAETGHDGDDRDRDACCDEAVLDGCTACRVCSVNSNLTASKYYWVSHCGHPSSRNDWAGALNLEAIARTDIWVIVPDRPVLRAPVIPKRDRMIFPTKANLKIRMFTVAEKQRQYPVALFLR